MKKLFSTEDISVSTDETDTNIAENDLDIYQENIDVTTENFRTTLVVNEMISNVYENVNKHKLGTESYFISMENSLSILSTVHSNLRLSTKFPSIEDFQNKYSLRTCHAIATEGIKEFLIKIWEKIKSFFIEVFKKIKLFFKRLLKLDLDLSNYEKYVEKMIKDIKLKKGERKSSTKTINTRLPQLLADVNSKNLHVNNFLSKGVAKIENLVMVNERYEKELPSIIRNTKEENTLLKDSFSVQYLKDIFANTESKIKEYESLNNPDDTTKTAKYEEIDTAFIEGYNSIEKMKDFLSSKGNFSSKTMLEEIDKDYLPDDVLSEVYDLYSPADTVVVHRFDTPNDMPLDFGVYKIKVETPAGRMKIRSITHKIDNSNVTNEMELLTSVDNIEKLYTLYKRVAKVDIKKITKLLDELDQVFLDRLDIFKQSFTYLEALNEKVLTMHTKKDVNIDNLTLRKTALTLLNSSIRDTLVGSMSFINEINVNTGKILGDIRYELIRYIYKCCEEF